MNSNTLLLVPSMCLVLNPLSSVTSASVRNLFKSVPKDTRHYQRESYVSQLTEISYNIFSYALSLLYNHHTDLVIEKYNYRVRVPLICLTVL